MDAHRIAELWSQALADGSVLRRDTPATFARLVEAEARREMARKIHESASRDSWATWLNSANCRELDEVLDVEAPGWREGREL